MAFVSVIILNYNTFQLTCNCIRSVIEKTKGIEYEIILVDNGSIENNPVSFEELFSAITYIASADNLGFAAGNNLGIKHAKGDFILLLNSDTELKNDAITLSWQCFQQDPLIAVVACQLKYPSGDLQPNCQPFPWIGKELAEIARLQKFLPGLMAKYLSGHWFSHTKNRYAEWVWGTFFLVRKSAINQLPDRQLPVPYFMYGEDREWCYQFHKAGYKIYFCSDANVLHLGGGSGNGFLQKEMLWLKQEHGFLVSHKGQQYAKKVFWLRAIKYLTLLRKGYSYKKKYISYTTFFS